MRPSLLALALVLLPPTSVSAEWQIRPSLGVTFAGGTTFFDFEQAAGRPRIAVGMNGVLLGENIGIEGDFGWTPRFFQSGDQHKVVGSSATTLTGNIVIALPRHLTQYTLRPYFVGGAGLMRARIDHGLVAVALNVASTLPAIDVGGGATGFLTDHVGLSWDMRYFRSISGNAEGQGLSVGAEQLSFWRANMALAIRF
jgi:hypothetical protein